jgi:hypothetical protein
MPDCAGVRTHTARFCLAIIMGLAVSGQTVQAAGDPQAWPEQDGTPPPHLYRDTQNDVTLTGFHCGVISSPSPAVFTADPEYRETSATIGLEMFLEEASAPPQASSDRVEIDDVSGGEMRTPLSARLSRIIVQEELTAQPDDTAMEDVFVPEASMSVADLVALCMP